MLPTLAPYPVDYHSTSTYYWPNIIENATQVGPLLLTHRFSLTPVSAQISDNYNSGVDTFEPDPANGPFGFGAALKLDGTQVSG